MRNTSFLWALLFVLSSLAWAQEQPRPTPPLKGPTAVVIPAEEHQKMMEMHKQHMAAMQTDLDKMKASLEQMKANVAKISDAGEKARWQSNVDLWTVMVGHMEHMMKEMKSMGPGMGPGQMHHHGGMEKPASPPPAESKPQ